MPMTSGHVADVRAQLDASTTDGYLAVSLPTSQVQWLLDTIAQAERVTKLLQAHIKEHGGCETCGKMADLFLDRLVL